MKGGRNGWSEEWMDACIEHNSIMLSPLLTNITTTATSSAVHTTTTTATTTIKLNDLSLNKKEKVMVFKLDSS